MQVTVTEIVVRVVVVAPQERIDALNAPALRQRLHTLLDEGATNVVIDLSAVPFMDSAGMAVLVSLLRRSRQNGGSVKLVWPRSEAVKRTLQLTQFDRVFEFVE